MAQIFSGDAVTLAADTAGFQNVETNGPVSNSQSHPFQTAKARLATNVILALGTGVTSVRVRIRRNANNENVVVADSGLVNVVASEIVLISLNGVDAIPDGRDVQYTTTVLPAGATSNIVMKAGSYLETTMLSG